MAGRDQSTNRSESSPKAGTPKPYATPRLVRYGSVESLTKGSTSAKNDFQSGKTTGHA